MYLHLGLLELGYYLLIDPLLHLHLILEIGLLGLGRLGTDPSMGVGIGDIAIAHYIIFGLGLDKEFLIILEIDTGLRRTVVGDEFLQTGLHRVSQCGTDQRILIGHVDGYHEGLLVDITDYILINGLGNIGLLLSQFERIDLRYFLFLFCTKETEEGFHTL